MKTMMLIDADVLAFQGAAVCQKAVQWEDDLWTVHADLAVAKAWIVDRIETFREKLKADSMVLALSDPKNFRRKLNPLYKANRKGVFKPIGLRPLKEWMNEEYGTVQWPNLEADDVLSILATERPNRTDRRIIVSIDKDFKGVPGMYYDFNKDEMHEPSVDDADRFHLEQVVSGDSTDGYYGVPGIGTVRAKRWLEQNGYTWASVMKLYEEKGLDEQEALMNAWMARLLRKDEYNIKRKELTYLWMPAHYPPAEKRKYSKVVRSVTGTLDEDDSALSPQPHFSPSPSVSKTEPPTTATTTG